MVVVPLDPLIRLLIVVYSYFYLTTILCSTLHIASFPLGGGPLTPSSGSNCNLSASSFDALILLGTLWIPCGGGPSRPPHQVTQCGIIFWCLYFVLCVCSALHTASLLIGGGLLTPSSVSHGNLSASSVDALTLLGTLCFPCVVVVPLDPLIRLHNVVSFLLCIYTVIVCLFYLTYSISPPWWWSCDPLFCKSL